MNTLKRALSILLALTLLASLSASVFALDVPGHTKEYTEKDVILLSKDSLSALLAEYRRIVQEIEEESRNWYADFSFGVLSDFDKDGYPEMVLLYSPDGTELESLVVCRTGEKKIETLRQYVCTLAGGATGSVAVGRVGKEQVIHIIYTNSAGPTRRMGWDSVLSFTKGKLAVKHTLEWLVDASTGADSYCVDGKKDAAKYRDIYDAILSRYRSSDDDGASTLSGLLKAIDRYKA